MKKLLFPLLLLLPLWASAQYSFTITGEYYGCGGKITAEMQRIFNQYMSQFQPYGIPTRTECEQLRASVNAVNNNYGGCGFRLKAGPCTGRDMDNTINIGAQVGGQTMNMQGAGQESSFFSPNSAIENKNWDKDIEERQRALNSKFVPPRTGDSKFDGVYVEDLNNFVSVNLRNEPLEENPPSEYFITDPIEFGEIHSKFEQETGIDIDEIIYNINKEKTDEELKALADYEEFWKGFLEEEERIKDMSVLCALVYKDCNLSLFKEAGYKYVTSEILGINNPITPLYNRIEDYNIDSDNKGFHAELFYNEKTNEYSLVFRGSELDDMDDWKTNVMQGLGFETKQYNIAIELGNMIKRLKEENPDIKINITGHSLGGGLATIAGVISGQPTYVFNPAGVHKNTFKQAGVWDKVQSGDFKIRMYANKEDLLTNTQEGNGLFNKGMNIIAHGVHGVTEGVLLASRVSDSADYAYSADYADRNDYEYILKMNERLQEALPKAIAEEKTIMEINNNSVESDMGNNVSNGFFSLSFFESTLDKIATTLRNPEKTIKNAAINGLKTNLRLTGLGFIVDEFKKQGDGHRMEPLTHQFIDRNNRIQQAASFKEGRNEEFKIYIRE